MQNQKIIIKISYNMKKKQNIRKMEAFMRVNFIIIKKMAMDI